MVKRGKYISFSGGEGPGKSTQTMMLYKFLNKKGINTELTREPGGTPEAEFIRQILLDNRYFLNEITEALLMSASRSESIEKIVLPALDKGVWVISDRCYIETLVYQGYGRGIEIRLLEHLSNFATQGVKPDLSFILDIDPIIGLRKQKVGDRIGKEELEFHQKLRKGFLELAEQKGYPVIPYIEGDIQGTQGIIRGYLRTKFPGYNL